MAEVAECSEQTIKNIRRNLRLFGHVYGPIDGSLVYDGNAHGDGSFQLLVQPADATPPKNWTSKYVATTFQYVLLADIKQLAPRCKGRRRSFSYA